MIKPGNIVFDIGANNGTWAKQAYSTAFPLYLYVFEPVPQIFNELKKTLAGSGARLFDFAISDKNGESPFFYYDNTADSSQLSSFYRRNKTVEKGLNSQPHQITIKSRSLDWFLENYPVRGDIDFVKIDTEGSEMDVLKGAAGSLQKNRIRIIQFEYGGTYLEAGVKLRDVYSFLASFNYDIYRIIPKGLVHIDRWRDKLENYRYSNYIAILKNKCDTRINRKIPIVRLKNTAAAFMRSNYRRLLNVWREEKMVINWIRNKKPIPPPDLWKRRVVKKYAERFFIDTFIETGTYYGEMVDAFRNKMRRIFSIELDITLYEAAKRRFSGFEHISILQGDNGDVLPSLLKDIKTPCIFWLDGHYSMGVTTKGRLSTPIRKELDAIFNHTVKGHVILIDDARLFIGKDDYPTIEELRNIIFERNPGVKFEIEDDIIRIY